MDWSRTFKAIWWLILVVTVGAYLVVRFPALSLGGASAPDVAVFLVWIGICLGPLYQEVELPGIKLRQEVRELKKEVKEELASFKAEVNSRVDVRSNVAPQFWFGQPPPDSELPKSEARALDLLEKFMRLSGHPDDPRVPTELAVDENVRLLFQARHNIEKELRSLAEPLELDVQQRRGMPLSRMLWTLTKEEIIPPDLGGIVREIYSVCSPAIHGEPVTQAQVDFVKETAPEVVAVLRTIARRSDA